jgi:hypothetical protein
MPVFMRPQPGLCKSISHRLLKWAAPSQAGRSAGAPVFPAEQRRRAKAKTGHRLMSIGELGGGRH